MCGRPARRSQGRARTRYRLRRRPSPWSKHPADAMRTSTRHHRRADTPPEARLRTAQGRDNDRHQARLRGATLGPSAPCDALGLRKTIDKLEELDAPVRAEAHEHEVAKVSLVRRDGDGLLLGLRVEIETNVPRGDVWRSRQTQVASQQMSPSMVWVSSSIRRCPRPHFWSQPLAPRGTGKHRFD